MSKYYSSILTCYTPVLMMFAHEDMEAIEKDNDAEITKCYVRSIWLKGTLEYKRVPVDALCFQGVIEAYVRNANAAPREKICDRRQVLEPSKDSCWSTFPNGQVCQKGD